MPNTSHTPTIIVTGSGGQLGQCVILALRSFDGANILTFGKDDLDITDFKALERLFQKTNPDYFINCAAYTNVEKAESEPDTAFLVNATATEGIASLCVLHNTVLIFPSTDYVFDGKTNSPYSEHAATSPLNAYGASKLAGEQAIEALMTDYYIIRTSWLYSQFGHNFYNSMVAKFKDGAQLTITTEQIGTPTNAHDLAAFIVFLVKSKSEAYGLYHYSNMGEATWYDFAQAIYDFSSSFKAASLGTTNHYATFAARPAYSVLSKDKCKKVFGTTVPHWKESLKQLMTHHL